jgi:hypothetical protein
MLNILPSDLFLEFYRCVSMSKEQGSGGFYAV